MAIRRFSTAEPGVKSNKFWDQDTQQGAIVPIAQTPSGSFLNIPQTYQDLMIVCNIRGTHNSTIEYYGLQFNANTANYSTTFISGNGSTASSSRWANMTYSSQNVIAAAQNTSGVFSSSIYHIIDYKNSSNFKTVLSRNVNDLNGSGNTDLSISLWRNTAPITRIDIAMANFAAVSGSTFTLYGIKAGA
jgi:hypothetical protein